MKSLKAILFLFFLSQSNFSHAAKVDTLSIASASMGKTLKAAVVLPNSYTKGKIKYPVMYLLHGAYGNFADWLKSTPNKMAVKELADQYNMIIVMPEGEKYSFYLDSPTNKESQFETHIIKEVIPKIDATYRTIAAKKGRVITGLSMGGHGAMYLSIRNPELFLAAGSMSGALDMGAMLRRDTADQVKKMMEPVFGADSGKQELYDANAILGMVAKMKANKMPLIIDVGVDDFLIESNRELHRRLVYERIPHEYTERPGAHTWEYWENSLPYHVLFFLKLLKANP